MTVYELAKKYYPRLWGDDRLNALVHVGKLTKTQAEQIRREAQNEAAG